MTDPDSPTLDLGRPAEPALAEAPPPAPPEPPEPAPPNWRGLAIQFTGSGSEYFRIWIVNLLLTVVTLSLYWPFAKARRLRYFHGNTLVDGHALGFHGDPKKMLRGYLLVLLFSVCYGVAGHFSPVAAAVAGVALAALWPALWQSSLRFRLANTSWRGLRFRFDGSVADAYKALLPALMPGVLIMVLTALQRPGDGAEAGEPAPWASALLGLTMLGTVALLPWLVARLRRYQHSHYQFAGDTTTLTVGTGQFYLLCLFAGLLSMAPIFVLSLLMGALAVLLSDGAKGAPSGATYIGIGLVMLINYGLFFSMAMPYFTARLQNLVWGNTRSPRVRFTSRLQARALCGLTARNLLLTVLTLGLYRPFAAVHTARLRLESVRVHAFGDVDQWVAGTVGTAGDASGDAAGDLLGVDIGL